MPSKPRFGLYTDGAGEWRWQLVATNEEIIATSGEGYVSKQGAEHGIIEYEERGRAKQPVLTQDHLLIEPI